MSSPLSRNFTSGDIMKPKKLKSRGRLKCYVPQKKNRKPDTVQITVGVDSAEKLPPYFYADVVLKNIQPRKSEGKPRIKCVVE